MGYKTDDSPSLGYRVANATLRLFNRTLRLLDGSARSHPGWDPYMLGGFAPIHSEVHALDLEVLEGQLPADLSGAFIRTGPNPKLTPEGGYHWFDGDGMSHVVRIRDGKASYCNRWVLTSRLQQEEKAGWPLAVKIGDYRGLKSLAYMALTALAKKLGVLSDKDGLGTANTALVYHAGRILSLNEGDLPYALRIACNGLVETVGRLTYDGKIQHAFTAHPKRDPETGELFYFGYKVDKAPHCWYGWLNKEGSVVRDMPVPLPQGIMMHDCALTRNYVLLLDVPLVFDPQAMVKEGRLPFTFQSRPVRIGVLPRYAESADEIRWFETDNFMCFHVANAWEEEGGNKIRLVLCTMKHFSLDSFTALEDAEPYISEVVIDLKAGAASPMTRLPGATPGDFPVVPPTLVGRPTKYTYVAAMQPDEKGIPRFIGVTKYNLQAGDAASREVGKILHGEHRLGGEAFFVAKKGASAEDAGYLITYVTDEVSLQSELAVYDAATMSSTPVVRLRIPQRVPHGFHCSWVTEEELQGQQQGGVA